MAARTREEGNAALGRDDYALAAAIYTRAMEDAPGDERLASNRSLAHYRLGDFAKALADAELVIELKPAWEKGYIRKALALTHLGASKEDVLACYEAGSTAAPSSLTLARAVVSLREARFMNESGQRELERERTRLHPTPSTASTSPPAGAAAAAGEGAGAGVGADAGPGSDGRISWDEAGLARHHAERGVLYARMKIDQPDTPFLVYDEEMAEKHNMIGTIQNKDSVPEFIDIGELQAKLGVLEEKQQQGRPLVTPGAVGAAGAAATAGAFKQKRSQLYKSEGEAFQKVHDTTSPPGPPQL